MSGETIRSLKATIEKLELTVKELLEVNAFLRKRVIELEDKLNIDSSNSGLPTSKEIYRKEKKSRPKSSRKIGAQPLHKHNGYKNRIPDKIIEVLPEESVCKCGNILELAEEYTIHQKLEIPEIKPYVREYRLRKKLCSYCNKEYRGKLADYKILGPNAHSIISSLTGCFNNSKRDLQSILSQIFNLDISLGLISNSERRVSEKLESTYDKLSAECRSSTSLHVDETGHNNQGKRHWCWVLANKAVTVFKLASSRGRKVIEGLLPSYSGMIISDRYAVYNHFDPKKRQICLAHLRRDFKRFAHSRNALLSRFGYNLLSSLDLVFAVYNGYRDGKVNKEYCFRKIRKLKKRIFIYLNKVRYYSDSEQASRVAANIQKSFDMMWRFTEDLSIPPTNNFAERQIKHHVKYRKNSLFTWSDRGDRFLERIKTIYATAKLRNLNPFLLLRDIILDSS